MHFEPWVKLIFNEINYTKIEILQQNIIHVKTTIIVIIDWGFLTVLLVEIQRHMCEENINLLKKTF